MLLERFGRVLLLAAALLPVHCYDIDPAPAPDPDVVPGPDFGAVIRGIRPRGFAATAYTLAAPAGGRAYYVSPYGDDAGPGTLPAPFRTINRAAQAAGPGDVVTIRDGVYAESVTVRRGGSAARRLVFQAEHRGGVLLTGGRYLWQPLGYTWDVGRTGPGYVTLRGLIFRHYNDETVVGTDAVRLSTGWMIDDCLFDASAWTGANLGAANDVVIRRSTFLDHYVHAFGGGGRDPRSGVQYVRGPLIEDVVLRHNNVTPTPLTGAVGTGVAKLSITDGAVIDNIDSDGNLGNGFWFDWKNRNYAVRNSHFHGNAARGLFIEASYNGLVENNVFEGNGFGGRGTGPGIAIVASSGVTIRGNLFRGEKQPIIGFNMAGDSSYVNFPYRDITITGNYFKRWSQYDAFHQNARVTVTPAEIGVVLDSNTYDPAENEQLAWWPELGGAAAIQEMRVRFGWEKAGRIAPIPW